MQPLCIQGHDILGPFVKEHRLNTALEIFYFDKAAWNLGFGAFDDLVGAGMRNIGIVDETNAS